MKARLIFPTDIAAVERGDMTWEGCEYSKCGRTDRGVSAFGQVIGIRVRSLRPLARKVQEPQLQDSEDGLHTNNTSIPAQDSAVDISSITNSEDKSSGETQPWDPINDELPYTKILNRLLPPDIRVLAWCPNLPKDFSARFNCRERRYRYFFTQPAFTPTAGEAGLISSLTSNSSTGEKRREGWLDVEAMNKAAKLYEGLHDFRNLCKLDPSKQIQNFVRRIYRSEIVEVDAASEPAAYVTGSSFAEGGRTSGTVPNGVSPENGAFQNPKLYQFILHGTAFLWHQVRHMVAILFLIGQGLEKPELVAKLLDVEETPTKPTYQMASDVPLVLWDCVFPDEDSGACEDALNWRWVGDEGGSGDEQLHVTSGFRGRGKFGFGGLVDDLWILWRQKKMDEVLAGSLLNLVVSQGRGSVAPSHVGCLRPTQQKTYYGGHSYENRGKYIPIMQRNRMEPIEATNQRWLAKNGDKMVKKKNPDGHKLENRADHSPIQQEVLE